MPWGRLPWNRAVGHMDKLEIRPARMEDLDAVWALVKRAVAGMNAQGNPQWGPDYPLPDDYEADIAAGTLFAAWLEGTLAGVACLSTDQAPEYAPLSWSTRGEALVIHRMAVDPPFQGRGIGGALFRRAWEETRRQGLEALRVDTYSLNGPMQRLILRHGFRRVGEVHFGKRPLPFPCFEKTG